MAWVISSEADRCAELPRAWNWVPGPRRSCLVDGHPHLSGKFGTRHGAAVNRGRNGPWVLYYDGTQAFRHSRSACLYNVYATRVDYPAWFRNTDAAWLWVAAFPGPVVKAKGLSTLLHDLATRLFRGADGHKARDVRKGQQLRATPFSLERTYRIVAPSPHLH